MRIGYGKIGRSYNLDLSNASVAGGDIDVVRGLYRLATARPDLEFVLIGRNSGEIPEDVGLPANVINPWAFEPYKSIKVIQYKSLWPHLQEHGLADEIRNLDGMVLWLGQHGTSNTEGRLPMINAREKLTDPQSSSIVYSGYLLQGVNEWRDFDPIAREEVWLCPDPRNYLKCRDNRWPLRHPVVAQYDQRRKTKHERYGDPATPDTYGFEVDRAWYDPDEPGLWKSHVDYTYSGLELTALPQPARTPFPDLNEPRLEFGVISNENRANVSTPRAPLIKTWVVDQFPEAPLYGIWSAKGMEALGRQVEPLPYLTMLPTMRQFRATCTFPASGSRWATAKPWEAFACGTICFFHPKYDEQDHILGDLDPAVRGFLRVSEADELRSKVKELSENFTLYVDLATELRLHYERSFDLFEGGVKDILHRLPG